MPRSSVSAHQQNASPHSAYQYNAPQHSAHLPHLQYLSLSAEILMLDLRPVQRMIMGFVLSLEKSNRRCYATNQYLATLCHVSPSTAQRAVTTLVERGLLRHFIDHQCGTHRLLSINTVQLEAEVSCRLTATIAAAQAGRPPKTMLARDLTPLMSDDENNNTNDNTTEAAHSPFRPAPITIEEERIWAEAERTIQYCLNVQEALHTTIGHLEDESYRRLLAAREQQMCAQVMMNSMDKKHPHTQEQHGEVLSFTEQHNTTPSPHFDNPPSQNENPPPQFDQPTYNQLDSKILYKKNTKQFSEDSTVEPSAQEVPQECSEEHLLESSTQEFSVQESSEETAQTQEQPPTALNAMNTVLHRAQERRQQRVREHHIFTQQRQQCRRETENRIAPSPTVPHVQQQTSTPPPPQTAYQQTAYQRLGELRRERKEGCMTFEELPIGAYFGWEGSAHVYGAMRKISPSEAMRMDTKKRIPIPNLKARVVKQP